MFNAKKWLLFKNTKEWDKYISQKKSEITKDKQSIIFELENGLESRGAFLTSQSTIIFSNCNIDLNELTRFLMILLEKCINGNERLLIENYKNLSTNDAFYDGMM